MLKFLKVQTDRFFGAQSRSGDCGCPNGDMFAAWYSCVTERGRELTVAASRLRFGETEWDPAEPFWVHRIGTITPPPSGETRTDGFIISTASRQPQRGGR